MTNKQTASVSHTEATVNNTEATIKNTDSPNTNNNQNYDMEEDPKKSPTHGLFAYVYSELYALISCTN